VTKTACVVLGTGRASCEATHEQEVFSMQEKNVNPGDKKPGEGQEWPETGKTGKPGNSGNPGKQGAPGDAGKKGGEMGESGEGDSRKSGDVDKKVHE